MYPHPTAQGRRSIRRALAHAGRGGTRRFIQVLLSAALLGVAGWAADAQAHGSGAAAARVITLSPSATELVYAAGAGRTVVATDRSSDYPPAARSLPHVGDAMQLNDEAILTLHPTLVIGWQQSAQTSVLGERLHDLGIPLIYANPRSLEDIPRLIRTLGARLDTQASADATAGALEKRIAALHPPPGTPQTVFIEVSADPLYTLGDDPIINDLLARCGGRNLYAGSRIAAPQASVESVLHQNPDVLIVSPYGPETLQVRRAWWARHGLKAAQDGRVYAIDPDWLHRPGPRLVDAAEAVCRDLRRPIANALS